jgi:cytidylate kinase
MFTDHKPKLASQQIKELRKITIWGVGLIGGSLGLALKKNGFQGQRVGLGRNIGRLENARQQDAVDSVTTELAEGIQDSDLIVLCTPVKLIPMFVKRIIESVDRQKKPIVVTDVGSTKSLLVQSVETEMRAVPSSGISYVGGHPMAGSHETGVDAARADLFENAKCILTPTEHTDEDALQLVKYLWEFVGAEPYLCSPTVHDQLIGAASHFPHLIASILANSVANVETPDGKALDFTATGFRDSTRIAAGSPELWTSIFTQNADVLLSLVDAFSKNLNEFRTFLETYNHTEIERVLLEAQNIVVNQTRKSKEEIKQNANNMTIALDGPAGSGKSTVARRVAEKIGLIYLETGAMYRAVTVLAIQNEVEDDILKLISLVKKCHLEFKDNGRKIFLNSEDVSVQIRTPEVNNLVADIAKVPEIRHEIVKHQRKIGEEGSIIAEGRDLTTIVFPDADYKFYLDASVKERAKRRFAELQAQNVDTTLEAVEMEISSRDEKDTSREHSPLRAAIDAIHVDTTDKTIDEVVDFIVAQVSSRN